MAGPQLSSIFPPQWWTAPSRGHFPGTLLLVEEFQSLLLTLKGQAAGRRWFSSAETKELVFYLRISVSFQTVFSAISEEILVGFVCLFVFSLTYFCVGDVSVLSLLQMGNR